MKYIITAIICILLASCSKEDVTPKDYITIESVAHNNNPEKYKNCYQAIGIAVPEHDGKGNMKRPIYFLYTNITYVTPYKTEYLDRKDSIDLIIWKYE